MEAWAAVLIGFAFIFIVARINKRARVKSPLIQRVERLIDAGYQLDRVIKAGRVRRMVEVEAEAEIEAAAKVEVEAEIQAEVAAEAARRAAHHNRMMMAYGYWVTHRKGK
jgi:hypothetical protein